MRFFFLRRCRTSTRTPQGRALHRPAAARFQPRLEALEDRWMPSTLTVTNNLDDTVGSLRYEINNAHNGDTIVFAPSLAHKTITLNYRPLLILTNLTIQGLGADQLTVSGNNNSRVFHVYPNGHLTLSALTVSNGNADSPYPQGPVHWGGGILNYGTLTISSCAIANNIAEHGAGIANYGTLTVSESTVARNHIFYPSLTSGGGIDNVGGTATLTNCTLYGNTAEFDGGGLLVEPGTTATLTNCTVAYNGAYYRGGGICAYSGGMLNLTNTIVAGNSAHFGPDIYGAVATADHNLVGDATGSSGIVNGVNGNIVGGNGNPVIDARLGPAQNNSGPTQTIALLAGSPAIGHANNAKAPASDQRGLPRIDEIAELTDIGAFEF